MIKPRPAREPNCIHSGQHPQPASACRICKDSPELRKWVKEWGAWLAENPDSYEARWVSERESLSEALLTGFGLGEKT